MGMMVGCKTGFQQTAPVFPNPANVVGQSFASGTTHNVNMVSGITAGQLILAIITSDGNATVTTPSGWTEIYSLAAPTNEARASLYAKVADGTESGTAVNFVTSSTEAMIAAVYRITDWGGTIATHVGYGTAATWDDLDTPTITTGWGAVPTLWFSLIQGSYSSTFVSSPAGYGGVFNAATGTGTAHAQHRVGWKQSVAASENPDAWGLTSVSGTYLAVLAYVR